jgi:hypothetical protein
MGTSFEDNNLHDALRYVALAHRMDNDVRACARASDDDDAIDRASVSDAVHSCLQRLAYKVTYRRLRLKLDYPQHPYNSNTHNRKMFAVTVKINDIDDTIQWGEGVHHPAVKNFLIANGVQVGAAAAP